MRKIIIMLLIAVGSCQLVAAQKTKPAKDSVQVNDSITADTPLVTNNDLNVLSQRLLSHFTMAESERYQAILNELNEMLQASQRRYLENKRKK